MTQRTVRAAAVTALVLVVCSCGGDQEQHVASIEDVGSFGFAHIDIMDLHAERAPDGSVRHRDILGAAEMDERFDRAVAAAAAFDRWSLYWDLIETSGGFDWSVADAMVERDIAAGLSPLVILQGTPPRYSTGGLAGALYPLVGGGTSDRNEVRKKGDVAPQASPPTGLEQPVFVTRDGGTTDDPRQASSTNPANPWARFVGAAVQRYAPGGELARLRGWPGTIGVRAWEVGNEPNLRHFWSGTPTQFVRYLEVAYLTVEFHDPSAIVAHGGIADDVSAPAWFRSFLAALTELGTRSELPARYGYYFDASAWHWYAYPDLLRTGPTRARGLLAEAGLASKPLWVTEYGVPLWSEYPGPCWDSRSPWRATTTEQAGYFWQAVAEGMASGIQLFVAFQLFDDCGNGPASYDAFGVVRNQGSNQCWQPAGRPCWVNDPAMAGVPRPAHGALAALASHLSGADLLWRPTREPAGWQRILFYAPPDRRVTVAWSTSREPVRAQFTATGTEAEVFSIAQDGIRTETRRSNNGLVVLDLAGSTNRNDPSGAALMGGLPVIVSERDTVPPFRSSVTAPPDDADGRFEVVVSGADGGTGVERYVLYMATGEPPSDPNDWGVLASGAWPGSAIAAEFGVPVESVAGSTVHFSVQLWDRAGNATDVPRRALATTRVGQGAPSIPVSAGAYLPLALAGHAKWEAPDPAPSPTGQLTSVPPTVTPGSGGGPPTATPVATAEPSATQDPSPSPTSLPAVTPSTATAEPGCTPVAVRVTDGRGRAVEAGSGTWVLRAFPPNEAVPRVSEAPVGTDQCVDFAPGRLEAMAFVPGYSVWPPQNLALSRDLALSVAPSQLVNGGFEAGLAGWILGGEVVPVVSREALSGAGAVEFGTQAEGRSGQIVTSLAQEVDVPPEAATLSLRMRFEPLPTCDGNGCRLEDRFDVVIIDLTAPGQPATVVTPRDGIREPSSGWVHLWYDLSAWEQRPVRITLALAQSDGVNASRAWIDEVALAPAEPPPSAAR